MNESEVKNVVEKEKKIGPSETGNFAKVSKPVITIEQLTFMKKWTKNFYSDEELLQHVNQVHDEICATNHVFGCISFFLYLKPCCRLHPIFRDTNLLDYARSVNPKTLFRFLDLGCCFGQETRDLLFAGIDPSQMFVSDVVPNYWEAAKKLFLDDPLHRPEGFIPNYDISQIESRFGDWSSPDEESTELIKGWENSFDVVMSWAVLHVLSKEQCDQMLKQIFKILKTNDDLNKPPSFLFGSCVGGKVATDNWLRTPSGKAQRFRHDANTLTQAFRDAGFTGEVKIEEVDLETLYDLPPAMTANAPKDPNQTCFFFTVYK